MNTRGERNAFNALAVCPWPVWRRCESRLNGVASQTALLLSRLLTNGAKM